MGGSSTDGKTKPTKAKWEEIEKEAQITFKNMEIHLRGIKTYLRTDKERAKSNVAWLAKDIINCKYPKLRMLLDKKVHRLILPLLTAIKNDTGDEIYAKMFRNFETCKIEFGNFPHIGQVRSRNRKKIKTRGFTSHASSPIVGRKSRLIAIDSCLKRIELFLDMWEHYPEWNRKKIVEIAYELEKVCHQDSNGSMKMIGEDLILNKLAPFIWELNRRGKSERLVKIYRELQGAYRKLNHWVRKDERDRLLPVKKEK